jgi:hypothetical protein
MWLLVETTLEGTFQYWTIEFALLSSWKRKAALAHVERQAMEVNQLRLPPCSSSKGALSKNRREAIEDQVKEVLT